MLTCIEPVYKEHINPTLARRLSRYIKMGVTTALTALKDAGMDMPGAIITGTGLGSTEDNEKILQAMLENQERMINPTHFIQSTHNTISAQIAIMLKCHHYNCTYVHRGFSFETALFDGMLLLKEKSAETALVGGVDALTEGHYANYARIGRWRANMNGSLQMIKSEGPGVIPGEGSACFLLGAQPASRTYAALRSMEMIFKPQGPAEIVEKCRQMLKREDLNPDEIDLVISGRNGDTHSDFYYRDFQRELFPSKSLAFYKHLCGEYDTASAFALYTACLILKNQQVPLFMLDPDSPAPSGIKNLLIYTHHRGDQHVLYLISRV